MNSDGHEYAPLSQAQRRHFELIFGLCDFDGDGDLELEELSRYMKQLGNGLTAIEIKQMMREVGVEPHEGDKVFLPELLTFVQRTLFAPLQKANLERIEDLFEGAAKKCRQTRITKAAAEVAARASAASAGGAAARAASSSSPSRPQPPSAVAALFSPSAVEASTAAAEGAGEGAASVLTKTETEEVLQQLGLHLDQVTCAEVFDEVDADGDGKISHDEFIAAVGMLKRNIVETLQLEKAFTRLRPMHDTRGQHLDEHLIYASDLVDTLGVTSDEAEEMIFIADLSSNRCVDIAEFKALVVNWTRS
jgi:Ca2+-binding EF-hand superfamily protein